MLNDLSQGQICQHKHLLLCVDGGCEPKNPGGTATAGWVLYDPKTPKSPIVEEGRVVQDGGPLATNNYGEYNALYYALQWLHLKNWKGQLTAKADSKLLVEQVCGRWKCKAPHLAEMLAKVKTLLTQLSLHIVTEDDPLPEEGKNVFYFLWIPRELNQRANDLCHLGYQEFIAQKDTKNGSV